MKKQEFRKLIREEIRRVLKEASTKAVALVVDEDGNFLMQDLSSYSEETSFELDGEILEPNEVTNYPNSVDAWAYAPQLAKSQNAKWKSAIAKLGNNYDYYDVISDGGENAFIAAVPKGTKPSDFISYNDDMDY